VVLALPVSGPRSQSCHSAGCGACRARAAAAALVG